MKNVKKKGFTIVELVIVVAVIAILAAVLIPTFSDLIKKANMSSDEVAVRNMNTILAAEQVMDDNIKDVSKVRSILAQAGYNSDNLVPLSKDYKFYWSSTYNVVLLVNCESENKAEWQVIYPTEGYERAIEEFENFDNHGTSVFNLADLPNAKVTKDFTYIEENMVLPNPSNFGGIPLINNFNNLELTDNHLTPDILLKFSAQESETEVANSSYREYYVDFIITVNKDISTEYKNTQFFLLGQYTFFSEYWVVADVTNLGIQKDVACPLLGGIIGKPFTYEMICSIVKEFNCGVVTLGEKPVGLEIYLQLVMFKSIDTYTSGKPDYIIYEYKQIY